jgi:putative hydrolase of the HAD superfamily
MLPSASISLPIFERRRTIEHIMQGAPNLCYGRQARAAVSETSAVARQSLIIDADDTLWENNIYFERAFEEFVAFLDHSSLSPREIRDVLDEIEAANAKIHGYGSLNFARNLRQCYEHLVEREVREEDPNTVMGFAERILECPMEVIEGVPETLEYLSLRHDLTLFTKGHPEEQKLKIDRSGLGVFFGHTAIVKEKDAAAYIRLARERNMDPGLTWMIGNSPKSDINPALEAGLNAVFVPHAHTWVLEKQEIRPGRGRLLVVERFSDLRRHF